MHLPGVDFDPDSLYAPVASKGAFNIILDLHAAKGLIIVEGDESCAYFYREIDTIFYMEQVLIQLENRSALVFLQVEEVHLRTYPTWNYLGSFFVATILSLDFKQSRIDARVFYKVIEKNSRYFYHNI